MKLENAENNLISLLAGEIKVNYNGYLDVNKFSFQYLGKKIWMRHDSSDMSNPTTAYTKLIKMNYLHID